MAQLGQCWYQGRNPLALPAAAVPIQSAVICPASPQRGKNTPGLCDSNPARHLRSLRATHIPMEVSFITFVGSMPRLGDAARRHVRSHVMINYRRRAQSVPAESGAVETSKAAMEAYQQHCTKTLGECFRSEDCSIAQIGSLLNEISCPLPDVISSPDMFRSVLKEAYNDGYFPPDTGLLVHVRDLQDVWVQRAWSLPTGRSFKYAADAVGLLQLGYNLSDQALLTAGRRSHRKAVEILKDELTDPRTPPEVILGSAQDIFKLEMYKELCCVPSKGAEHLAKIVAIYRTRGPAIVRSPLAKWMFGRVRMLHLIQSLISRKAFAFPIVRWQSVTPAFTTSASCESIIRLACSLTKLLQKSDEVLNPASGAKLLDYRTVLKQLLDLGARLLSWLSDALYEVVRTSDLVGYVRALGSVGEPFGSCPQFRDLADFSQCSLYGMCSLLLWSAAKNIHSKLPCSTPALHRERTVIDDYAHESASFLAACLPYAVHVGKGTIYGAMAVRAPLYFLHAFYANNRDEWHLKWCGRMESVMREEVVWVHWDSLLPWALFNLMWAVRL